MNNGNENQQEVNAAGRNDARGEGSVPGHEHFLLNRTEGTDQPSVPHCSADDQRNTGRRKRWTKRSQLCNRKKKGNYNHTQDRCRYLHAQECTICHEHVLHPLRPNQRDSHIQKCQARLNWEAERIEASRTVMCPICLGIVLDNETEASKMFTILENCKHVSCWSCYQTIKKHHAPRKSFREWSRCQECRQPFGFAISSKFWVEDEENRKRIISKFRVACRRRLCYQFRRTGRCDAGELCIFRHRSYATLQNYSSDGDDHDWGVDLAVAGADDDDLGVVGDDDGDWSFDGNLDEDRNSDSDDDGTRVFDADNEYRVTAEDGTVILIKLINLVLAHVMGYHSLYGAGSYTIETTFRGWEQPGRIFFNGREVPLPTEGLESIRRFDVHVNEIRSYATVQNYSCPGDDDDWSIHLAVAGADDGDWGVDGDDDDDRGFDGNLDEDQNADSDDDGAWVFDADYGYRVTGEDGTLNLDNLINLVIADVTGNHSLNRAGRYTIETTFRGWQQPGRIFFNGCEVALPTKGLEFIIRRVDVHVNEICL